MKRIILVSLTLILISSILVSAQQETVLYFFWSNGCPHCAAEKPFLEEMKTKYPNLEVKDFDVSVGENAQLFVKMTEAYGTDPSRVPKTFVGEEYFSGYGNYEDSGRYIEEMIYNCVENGCIDPTEKITADKEPGEISLFQLLGLAGTDAINPCELAVLVILMTSILTKFPKKKMKALKVGLSFSSAIFIIYFVFGLLIIAGFKFIADFAQVKDSLFYQILALIAIILGALNIKDAIWYGGGGFIMEVPMKWRPKMKELINGATTVKGAFIVGLIVSFFLTPCTGGPYLLAGGLLSNVSWLEALPYLLIYMCIFISPMIAITLIVYFGFMAVEDVGGWREKNIKKLHWIAGLLLLGLGIAMLLGLI